ncbi:hypothetical protein ES703_107962 [subsurface metagenome]
MDISHPVVVHFHPPRGVKGDLSGIHGFPGRLGQFFHIQEPLHGEIGFYLCVRALGIPHTAHVVFQLFQQALALHLGHYRFPGLEAIHPAELLRDVVVKAGVGKEDVHRLQAMTLTQLIVIGIVGRSDFYSAGTEFGIYKLIGDDGHLPPYQWQDGLLSH